MSLLATEPDRTVSTFATTRSRNILAGLNGKAWFPQVPVSFGIALLGLLHLIPVLD